MRIDYTPGFVLNLDHAKMTFGVLRDKDYEGNTFIVEKRMVFDNQKGHFQGIPEYVIVQGKKKKAEFYFLSKEGKIVIYRPTSQELSRSPELGGYRVLIVY